jgi:hypothetical protein
MKTRSLVALASALLCAAAVSFSSTAGAQDMSADLVIVNANVHTLEKSRPAGDSQTPTQ